MSKSYMNRGGSTQAERYANKYNGSGHNSSNHSSNTQTSLTDDKDIQHCMIKHTLNLDGSRGGYGDFEALKCVVDRKAERVAERVSSGDSSSRGGNGGSENCIISHMQEIKYSNSFLQNHSPEKLLSIYKTYGIEAVNNILGENILACTGMIEESSE